MFVVDAVADVVGLLLFLVEWEVVVGLLLFLVGREMLLGWLCGHVEVAPRPCC